MDTKDTQNKPDDKPAVFIGGVPHKGAPHHHTPPLLGSHTVVVVLTIGVFLLIVVGLALMEVSNS